MIRGRGLGGAYNHIKLRILSIPTSKISALKACWTTLAEVVAHVLVGRTLVHVGVVEQRVGIAIVLLDGRGYAY